MRRVLVSAVVCCLVFAFFGGCQQNEPPATPQLSGPAMGEPDKSLAFIFKTTDPEDQDVDYLVSWGDDTEMEWDEGYASGEEVRRYHKFTDSGVYYVKVKARDSKEAESGWSDSIMVAIGFWPPNQPQPPTGPAACTTGVAAIFAAKTTHPLGDSVWFQFDWGDTVGDWGGPVASDSVFREQHTFDSAGVHNVMVRAKDARERTSAWSNPLAVTVVYIAPPARPVVTCELLERGGKLRLIWGKIADAQSYEVTTDDSVHTTTDTTFDVAKPCVAIEVRAVKGSQKSDPAVVPVGMVETASLVVYGISAYDSTHLPSFGFDSTGTAVAYSLSTGNYPKIDFYLDDRTHPDTMFMVNPGIHGWNAKGNAFKFSGTSTFDDAKLADTAGYETQNLLTTDLVYYLWIDLTNNGWSPDDHFAKAKVISISGAAVTLRLGYQRVGGLRWLRK